MPRRLSPCAQRFLTSFCLALNRVSTFDSFAVSGACFRKEKEFGKTAFQAQTLLTRRRPSRLPGEVLV